MLSALLNTSHEEPQEREVRWRSLAKGVAQCSRGRMARWPELGPGKADPLGWNLSSAT